MKSCYHMLCNCRLARVMHESTLSMSPEQAAGARCNSMQQMDERRPDMARQTWYVPACMAECSSPWLPALDLI